MNSRDAFSLPEDLKPVIAFHGHLCPGVLIGYRASKAGMEALGAKRSEDEELIAIVENDACGADAVQFMTGCTFGKGNFYFRDYGKQAFTFALRPSGRAVRVALRPDAGRSETDPEESEKDRRERRIRDLLTLETNALFSVEGKTVALPPPARIRESVVCAQCGEKVMATRTKTVEGRDLCIPCAESVT